MTSFSNKTIEALKMAIEALESIELLCDDKRWYLIGNARNACKEALASLESEALAEAESESSSQPVAWMMLNEHNKQICITETNLRSALQGDYVRNLWKDAQPLYTHPATWQSLSDDEIWNLINNSDIPADYDHEVLAIAHAIDAKLKEKNHG